MGKLEDTKSMQRRKFLKVGVAVAAGGAAAGTLALAGKGSAQDTPAKHTWAFIVDLRLCSGCEACVVSCKNENFGVLGKFRTGVKFHESGTYPKARRTIVPWLCNHCNKPICIENCPADPVKKPWGASVAATYKRPDGVVVIDKDRCLGCGACVADCPYGVRYLHPDQKTVADPDLNAADKCDFCLHRLERGVAPSCANTCPAGARRIVDLADSNDEGNKVLAENKRWVKALLPGKGTDPQCFYIDPDGLLEEAYAKAPDRMNRMNKGE